MSKAMNLVGRSFGRLTAVVRNRVDGKTYYYCTCSCGGVSCVEHSRLVGGVTKSCGCLARETTSRIKRKHGHTVTENRHSRIYQCWSNMKRRCYDENNVAFHNYGGRGISVCDRWRNDFEAFLKDMGDMPDGLTIERIDKNGNYEPDNCRWATTGEQSRNTRDNLFLSCLGVSKCITDWEILLKTSRCAIKYQIRKRGEEAAILYFLTKKQHRS